VNNFWVAAYIYVTNYKTNKKKVLKIIMNNNQIQSNICK